MKTRNFWKKRIVSFIICCSLTIGIFVPVSKVEMVYADSVQLERAAQWAVAIANDNSHGYSQANRWGPDYDCSSLIISALKYAGFDVGSSTYTGNMRANLDKRGFDWIPWSQISGVSNLKRGDILLNEVYHTAMYIGNGKLVEGRCSENGGKYGMVGDQTGQEIRVCNYYNYSKGWDGVLRYKETPLPINTVQVSLDGSANRFKRGKDIAFHWTWGGEGATGYDLYIAKQIPGTTQYDWNNARRVYFPGQVTMSGVVDASVFSSGTGFAAYMQAWNTSTSEYGGQSNFVYFTIYDEQPQMKIWISRTKMGREVEVLPIGKACYLCYQIMEKYTQKPWDEEHSSVYGVTAAITTPNGEQEQSPQYTNDSNCFAFTPTEAGEYKGRVEVTGSFAGDVDCSILAKKIYYGDLNGDDDITVSDLSEIMKAVQNPGILSDEAKRRADVNADGVITEEDVTLVNQYILGAITEFPAESHVHDYSSRVVKNATCMSVGIRLYTCACGESYAEKIPKTSHTPAEDSAVAATCTENGKAEGSHCSVCKTVLTEQETVNATGHTHTEVRNAKPATTESAGYTGDVYCKDCGMKLSAGDVIEKIQDETEKEPTEGHVHDYSGRVTKSATCFSEGMRTYTCACGASYTETIPKASHTPVEDPAVAATCTENGKKAGSHCSVCGKVLTEQETVNATGHTHTEVRNAKLATDESDGYTGDVYCKDCGAKISSGKVIEKILGGAEEEPDDGTDDPNEDDETDEDELEVGDMVYDASGKAEYEVIQMTGTTVYVSYNATLNKKQKVVTVPNQIRTREGMVCKVTAVSERAFYNDKCVRKIVLGSNVVKIGNRAFSGCKKLASLTIKSGNMTSKSLSKKAFKGLSFKTKIKAPKAKRNFYKKLFYKKGLSNNVKICNM